MAGQASTFAGRLQGLTGEDHARTFFEIHEGLPSTVAVMTAVRDDDRRIVDFQVEYLNAAGRRRLGLDMGAEEDRRLSEIDPGLVQAGLLDQYRQVVDTGRPMARVVVVPPSQGLVVRDRSETLEVEAVKFADGVAVAFRNLTDQVEADRLGRSWPRSSPRAATRSSAGGRTAPSRAGTRPPSASSGIPPRRWSASRSPGSSRRTGAGS